MDDRLEKALDISNFQRVLKTRQTQLKLLMENRMKLLYQGGIFDVDPDLITFTNILIGMGKNSFIFIDVNDNPIFIEDLKEFLSQAYKKYVDALEQYYASYQKLGEARKIRKVLEWDEE
jgi:hypothetical protein